MFLQSFEGWKPNEDHHSYKLSIFGFLLFIKLVIVIFIQFVDRLAIFLALFILTMFPVFSQSHKDVKFDLVREDPPIFVHERWITFPGKVPAVKAREVKSEFVINASISTMLSLLRDESKIKIWQKHVSDFEVYPLIDSVIWLEYSYHDIPWPVSDQDHFLRYEIAEKINGKLLFIKFQSVIDPVLSPVKRGVTRMELSGSWLFEQVSDQQVKITYRILSMPSSIPRMFTDPVIRGNLMSTVKALTKLAEEKKKAGKN